LNRATLSVWGAVLLFAAANSIVSLLNQLGLENPVDGRNAISFCNVLFVGNLCAAITLFGLFRKDWKPETLRGLAKSDWVALVILAILSGALAPSLIFLAIENTTVTNVVLVGRVEPLILLGLSMLLLGDRADKWTLIGLTLSVVGVVVTLILQSPDGGLMLGKGELMAAGGAAVLAASTIVSKLRLKRIPLGIFTVVRTSLGAVIFFFTAIYLYGIEHFMDAFSPLLWQTMAVYGAVIVVGGQLLWITGIKGASASEVSLATSFSPVAGVGFAFLILGEVPDMAVLIGGAIILTGIFLAQGGKWMTARREAARSAALDQEMEMEGRVGFKGV